ncbi:MAG: alpha/beta hydrolase [Longimicrobiales bacterium]
MTLGRVVGGLLVLSTVVVEVADGQTDVRRFELTASDGVTVYATEHCLDQEAGTYLLLFHQGGASGEAEYGPIIPRLCGLGYRPVTIDQRAGGELFGGVNRTATALGAEAGYCDALPDLEAALDYAAGQAPGRPAIVWGSSYSAALVFYLARDRPDDIAGVLAFSPASGEPMAGCIPEEVAGELTVPVLALRPGTEAERESVAAQIVALEALGVETYTSNAGSHGSSMLVEERVEAPVEDTWAVVLNFLARLESS